MSDTDNVPARDPSRATMRVVVGVAFAIVSAWDLLVGALTGDVFYLAVAVAAIVSGVAFALNKGWGQPAVGLFLLLSGVAALGVGRYGLFAVILLLFIGFLYAVGGPKPRRQSDATTPTPPSETASR